MTELKIVEYIQKKEKEYFKNKEKERKKRESCL